MYHNPLKSLLLTTLLFIITNSQPPIQSINQTVAIQQTNQTFFTYIPLSSDCTYYPLNSNITLGDIKYTLLDAFNIFQSICGLNEVVFWGGLVNGLKMLANSQELLQNGTYNQIVLLNSTINSNLTQRQLILVNIGINSEIIFNYAQPVYNYTDNTLTSNLVSQSSYILDQNIQKIIKDCGNNNLLFNYIGNQTYLGLCINTSQLFSWNISDSKISYIFTDLSFLNGDNIGNMTNNPYLLVPNFTLNTTVLFDQNLTYWNVAFLTQDVSMAYFCLVNISQIRCQNYQKEEMWVEMVIQGGWGVETIGQLSQIELILSLFPQITNFTFPGTIISLFSYEATVFVQSQNENTTYLSIFSNSRQLTNTTLKGTIIYYGQQNLLIQDSNNDYWIAQFILPIYYIQNYSLQTNSTLFVNCSYTDYELFYDIFWTSMNYPSYQIQELFNQTLVSYEGTLVEDMNDYYLVIGPAFQVFISESGSIDINLLDISQMLTIQAFICIVDIVFISQNGKVQWIPYQAVLLDLLGVLKKFSFSTQEFLTMPQPCSMQTITNSVKVQNTLIFVGQGNICSCDISISNCSIVTPQQVTSTVLLNSNSMSEYYLKMNQIQSALGFTTFTSSKLKKQIAAMASYDLIINIYQNNTVILTNLQGNYIDSIESNCIEQNSTDGTVFPRNFYDDYLVIYCYNNSAVTQYLIRNQQLVYNRDIPLYGFLTISDQNSIIAGKNYIFLQVDLNPQFFGIFQSRTNASSCCILRLDPDQFTVSVIAQIILANKLITVYSMYSVDIVFYNETTISSSIPFVKVYFDSTWVTFKQTAICTPLNFTCPPTTYSYGVSYISDFYNFAGGFINNITFDISASKITLSGSDIQDIQLYKYVVNFTIYNNSVVYNFNNFCGPISQFWQTNIIDLQGNLFSINQNKIIISNKQITSNYSVIIQIMDIGDYVLNNSLSQCILVVGLKNLTFYVKYDGNWMSTSYVVQSTQYSCLYFINQIIDNYTIQFGSDCFHIQTNTPLITVTYNNPSLNTTFSSSITTMKLPLQLRSVTSILTNNETYIIGLEQGPSKSVTGVLYLCNSVCNLLTIDTEVIFFIDYDQQITQEGLLVVSLDIQTLNFWINPNLSPFNNQSIPADYIVNYQQELGSFCSKVKIVYGSLTQPNLILSCSTFYQQITVNLSSQNIILGLKFAKFANCQQIDRFKPQFILSPNSYTNISFVAVQCQQTVSTVRIEQITSQNSNTSSNIVTAYLMIYTQMGPRCTPTYWYPIRIINLGISAEFMLYSIYSSNNQWKIIYQKINGILIDAFIEMVPQVNYSLIEMTRTVTYPVIVMMINNPYYSLAMTIETHSPKDSIPQVYFYTILGVYVSFNVITLFFLICWCFMNKRARNSPKTKYFNNARKTLIVTSKSDSSKMISDKESVFSSAYQNSSSISRQKPSMNQQTDRVANKPQPKRRGTEIELFQPR